MDGYGDDKESGERYQIGENDKEVGTDDIEILNTDIENLNIEKIDSKRYIDDTEE